MSDQLAAEHGNADPLWAVMELAIREHISRGLPRHEKMWAYYRNPLELVRQSGRVVGNGDGGTRGWYRSAQEVGLPERIVGRNGAVGLAGSSIGGERGRREVVIENDIGWRIGTMVDFMFGSPIRIESLAEDEGVKHAIEEVLESVWESSGGISLMQDMATFGHVFGHVVVFDGVALEVVSVESATSATVSLMRGDVGSSAIPGVGATSQRVEVFGYGPQLGMVHRQVLSMIGLDPDGADFDESVVTNPGALVRLEALGALHLIYAGAGAPGTGGQKFEQRAQMYKQRFASERERVVALVDLDGDGIAEVKRRPNLFVLNRG